MIEKAIHSLLSGLCSGRVYALVAPQNATAPFIVYHRQGGERWRAVDAPSGMAQVTIQVDAYDNDFYGMKDLAASIEAILDGYRGTVSYGSNSPQDTLRIGGIALIDESDTIDQSEEPPLHRNSTDYSVIYEQ